MKAWKNISVLLATVPLVLSACSSAATSAPAASVAPASVAPASVAPSAAASAAVAGPSFAVKQPPFTIGVSNISTANPWRVQMDTEAKYFAQQNPDLIKSLLVVDANDDINKQISDVEDFIAKKVDLIVIAPATPDGVNGAIAEAVAAGIPVVSWNNSTTSPLVPYQYASPYYDYAKIQAAWLAQQMGGKGNVIGLRGIAGASVDSDEWRAFTEMMTANPGIKVICQEYASWDYGQAKTAVANCLANHPDVNGVLSIGDSMTWAAAEALITGNYDVSKIPMVGIGAGNGPLKFFASHPQIPVNIIPDRTDQVVSALKGGISLLQGQPVGSIYIPAVVITQANIAQFAKPSMPDMVWLGTSLPDSVLQEQAPK